LIIGFVGFINSGKSTASKYLIENHNFTAFAFADSLKDSISSIFCWSRDMIDGNTKESREWRDKVDLFWANRLNIPNLTPRFVLQNFGTILRNNFHVDIFISNVERKISMLNSDYNIVITDIRYKNEIDLVRKLGGKIYRIKRGNDPEWFSICENFNGSRDELNIIMSKLNIHESEWDWINSKFDDIILNNSIDNLYAQIKQKIEEIS